MTNKTSTSFLLVVFLMLSGFLSTGWASPIALHTPTGLNPGDKFRFIFVTTGTRNATSTDIADYNTFVNTDAGGATYNGSAVTWKAIGSTTTVNARDNVGGFGTNVPVYLVTGTKVANSLTDTAGGLWGVLSQSLQSAIVTFWGI